MCNCQNNNYNYNNGCANANCSCPPNYCVNPATIPCQGTICEDAIQTPCVFSTAYLSCTKLPANTDLQTILSTMDAKICQCGSCSGATYNPLYLFYVDSNNSNNGDGSVANPFKTIDLAYNAVLGSGTTSSPQHANAGIYVMAGSYSTAANIYIPTTYWTFYNGANVTFTGSGYFIDSSSVSDGAAGFIVTGYLNFQTSTGGFLRNNGGYSSASYNKSMYIEAYQIYGNTNNNSTPLINHTVNSSGSGYARPSTHIKLSGNNSVISSSQNDCVYYSGSSFSIDLNGGYIYYGVDLIAGKYNGNTSGHVFNHNVTETVNPGSSFVIIRNGFYASAYNNDVIVVSGKLNTFIIENVHSISFGSTITQPLCFLNIAIPNSNVITTDSLHFGQPIPYDFVLKNVYLNQNCFSNNTVIRYTGSSNVFNYLNMQNCVLYSGCSIQNSSFAIGYSDQSGTVGSYNIINGLPTIYNLPTSSVGLVSGSLWRNGNVVEIV